MHRIRKSVEMQPAMRAMLLSVFWMLLLNQFITSFAGQMYHVSYRLIVFVVMGSILGTFYSSAYARVGSMQRK
jgi:hypothetical protein